MWRTQIGERALQGAEAALFRVALGSMVDLLDEESEDEGWDFSTPVFDRLSPPQKLALLADVGTALLHPSVSPPELNAVNEATVSAVYEHIWQETQFEIDSDEPKCELKFWRKAILAVFQEEGEGEDDLPAVDCTDFDDWRVLIDCLRDRILWDDDFNSEDLFVDCEPEKSRYLKAVMRIDNDYFSAIPPDPSDSELEDIRVTLHELTRSSA